MLRPTAATAFFSGIDYCYWYYFLDHGSSAAAAIAHEFPASATVATAFISDVDYCCCGCCRYCFLLGDGSAVAAAAIDYECSASAAAAFDYECSATTAAVLL